MKLSIYSLQKVLYEGEAKSVNLKTAAGEITILDHHRPLISMLKEGVITIIDQENKEHYVDAKSGFIEVEQENSVRILVDQVG